jgi:hypothetical protein
MSVYVAPKKWPSLDDSPSNAEVSLNLRRVFNTLNDHDQAINTLYANTSSSTNTTISTTTTSGVSSFNAQTGDVTFFQYLGAINNQTGSTSYTTLLSDDGALILLNNASSITISLGTSITTPWYTTLLNLGAGTATLIPASGTINNLASVDLYGGCYAIVAYDGAKFWAAMLPIATTSQFGLVKPDGTTVEISSGVISVPTATTLSLGIVKPDNSTIFISSGILSLATPVTVTNGGTGTSSPSLVAGSGISISGSWPGQTIAVINGTYLPINNPTFTGVLTGPHYKSNGLAPGIVAGAAAGTGPTVSIGGTDTAGILEVIVGTSPTTGVLCTLTFAVAFSGNYAIFLNPASTQAATIFANTLANPVSTTEWQINVNIAPTAGSTLSFYYYVIDF